MPDSLPCPWYILGQDPPPDWLAAYPKIARLHELRRQGLAVPSGWFKAAGDHALTLPCETTGPWILRSVMPSEDAQGAKLTGLSRSVLGVRDQKDLDRAQRECQAHLTQLRAQGILPDADPSALAWLLQTQVQAQCLVIGLYNRDLRHWYLESYAPGEDPFAGTQAPLFCGQAKDFQDATLSPKHLKAQLHRVQTACLEAPGLEVEMVLDGQGQWYCVQTKALAVAPGATHQSFLDAANAQLRAQGRSLGDYPRLVLDAEHNPEPLSPAHTWLMSALSSDSSAPGYIVLCGWLYEIGAPKAAAAKTTSTGEETHAPIKATLLKLSGELLPAAREHHRTWATRWTTLCTADIPTLLDHALAGCRTIFDARRQWVDKVRAQRPSAPAREDFSFSATLADKATYADVLPTRWDISAPSLSCASLPSQGPFPQTKAQTIPQDPATQWALLDEWDDHLFAIGLDIMRQAWLKIAQVLAIPASLCFFADGEQLIAHAKGTLDKAALLRQCIRAKQRYQTQCSFDAPSLLLAGRPALASSQSCWHGLGLGESVRGKLYQRRDLEALLADPPPPSSILAMPALTAPAALALHHLQIRAVVTQYGGVASHGARMAAELGMSALIGCAAGMQLPEASSVWLDTKAGRLWNLPDA